MQWEDCLHILNYGEKHKKSENSYAIAVSVYFTLVIFCNSKIPETFIRILKNTISLSRRDVIFKKFWCWLRYYLLIKIVRFFFTYENKIRFWSCKNSTRNNSSLALCPIMNFYKRFNFKFMIISVKHLNWSRKMFNNISLYESLFDCYDSVSI